MSDKGTRNLLAWRVQYEGLLDGNQRCPGDFLLLTQRDALTPELAAAAHRAACAKWSSKPDEVVYEVRIVGIHRHQEGDAVLSDRELRQLSKGSNA